jgi:hypothetical protein
MARDYTTHKILDSKIDKCIGYITALVANSKWEIDKAKLSAKSYYDLDSVEQAILNLKFNKSIVENPLPKAIANYTIAEIELHMQAVTKQPKTKLAERLEPNIMESFDPDELKLIASHYSLPPKQLSERFTIQKLEFGIYKLTADIGTGIERCSSVHLSEYFASDDWNAMDVVDQHNWLDNHLMEWQEQFMNTGWKLVPC